MLGHGSPRWQVSCFHRARTQVINSQTTQGGKVTGNSENCREGKTKGVLTENNSQKVGSHLSGDPSAQ